MDFAGRGTELQMMSRMGLSRSNSGENDDQENIEVNFSELELSSDSQRDDELNIPPKGAICDKQSGTPESTGGAPSASTTEGNRALKRQDSDDDVMLRYELSVLEVTEPNRYLRKRDWKPVMHNAVGMPVALVASVYDISAVTERNPLVDVERFEGCILQVHITCVHKAGILKKFLTVLDLKDAEVHYSHIFCRDNLLSVHLGFERKNVVLEAGEEERLKEIILGIISSGDVSKQGPTCVNLIASRNGGELLTL